MVRLLVELRLRRAKAAARRQVRALFKNPGLQRDFQRNGFIRLPLLTTDDISRLRTLFTDTSGGTVSNSDYGMYISLEEHSAARNRDLIERLSAIVLPRANEYFLDCKPHLGSFLVKAPDDLSYTYPHQDWTFVDPPQFTSVTIWIALDDTGAENGMLGFVPGSHLFFDKAVGTPSPEFVTCTQGHEAELFEFLEFVPLKAGEALVFDNRTIHGASPNRTDKLRRAVAVGMTPREAPLYHYYLVPDSQSANRRTIAKLKVEPDFFITHSMVALKHSYENREIPEDCEVVALIDDEISAYTSAEIVQFCEQSGLVRNGLHLEPMGRAGTGNATAHLNRPAAGMLRRVWNALQGMRA